jgi:hypothetical protein
VQHARVQPSHIDAIVESPSPAIRHLMGGCMRRFAITMSTTLGLALAGCHHAPAVAKNTVFPDVVPAAVAPVRPSGGGGNSSGAMAVGDFVRSRSPQLQFCYEETRAKTPNLAGSATVAVQLAADGGVNDASIVRKTWSGKGADSLESCVMSRVKSWRFPASEDGNETRVHSFSVIFTR